MSVRRAFLGASFTTYVSKHGSSDAIIDNWFGSSSLYGWDTQWGCLDRIPILLKNPEPLSSMGVEFSVYDVDVELELIGSESDYMGKILEGLDGVSPQDSWIVTAKPGRYLVRGGACSFLRMLASKSAAVKVFDELRLIRGRDGVIVTANTVTKCSEGIVSTMPLDYVARKAGYRNPPQPPYASLYVTLAIINTKHASGKVGVKLLGKRRYSSLLIVSVPAEALLPRLEASEEVLVVYALTVLRSGRIDPSVRQKTLSDLKRLGYDVRSASLIRCHFEKYGILGQANKAVEDLKNYVTEQRVKPAGRLGLWRELSVEDALRLARCGSSGD